MLPVAHGLGSVLGTPRSWIENVSAALLPWDLSPRWEAVPRCCYPRQSEAVAAAPSNESRPSCPATPQFHSRDVLVLSTNYPRPIEQSAGARRTARFAAERKKGQNSHAGEAFSSRKTCSKAGLGLLRRRGRSGRRGTRVRGIKAAGDATSRAAPVGFAMAYAGLRCRQKCPGVKMVFE